VVSAPLLFPLVNDPGINFRWTAADPVVHNRLTITPLADG